MEYTYAILDSNATSVLQLQLYLDDFGDFVNRGVAPNAEQGLNLTLKYNPDVLFINLTEDGMSHFQMVAELSQYIQTLPVIIGYATTKDHAYNAIKSGFFDYWILPHNEFDIRKTIMRLGKYHPKNQMPVTICLKTYNDYRYLETSEILYLKSDNNVTDFCMRNGQVITAFKTLKFFETILPESFIRIHQSYIVNSRYVSRINYGKGICTLHNEKEEELPFSKTYRPRIDALKETLSKTAIGTLN